MIVKVLVKAVYVNDTSEDDAINPLTVLKKLTASEKVAIYDVLMFLH